MSPVGIAAEVWPSRLALEQRRGELGRAQAGGLWLERGGLYTFEGRHGLLEALCGHDIPGPGRRRLAELAGPLLVHRLLRDPRNSEPLLTGVAQSRRLPHRLWRLLVQVRAAGLDSRALAELAKRQGRGAWARLEALARLLALYEQAVADLGLADEADLLSELASRLARGERPDIAKDWASLSVRQALWLRPLDLRLLGALAPVLPVRVHFALLEPARDTRDVFALLRRSADYLESGAAGALEVSWADPRQEGGPLAALLHNGFGLSDDAEAGLKEAGERLELWRAAGRYAEVEALVRRARELVEAGVPHHEIALVFPDLAVQGQMAADAAARIGLTVSFRRGAPLGASPLAQAFLGLLELPLASYERQALARVWESPYLGPALARLLAPGLGEDAARRLEMEIAPRAGGLLLHAGYVDARETPVRGWLEQVAQRSKADRSALEGLARACAELAKWLEKIAMPTSLKDYAKQASQYLAELKLDLAPVSELGLGADWPSCPGQAEVFCRDLAAGQRLTSALRDLASAAEQVEANEEAGPARLLAQVREALADQDAGPTIPGGQGVAVLRLEDAQGLSLHTALVGGLNQGEFPRRPAQHLLSGPERLALGRRAGLPVWRTEEEEYGGQVMRLLLLLSQARQGAVLSCSAADAQGRQQPPSFIMTDLAQRLGRELPLPQGGVYGELAPLEQALDPLDLWAGLAARLARPQHGRLADTGLAQAALWAASREPGPASRWRDLARRAWIEEERAALDLLTGPARLAASGPFSGRLAAPQALGLLRGALLDPGRRRLSSSWLEDYAGCPQAWFFGRLLGLGPLRPPGWDLERDQEGMWVHRALALFFAPGEFEPAASGEDERRERLLRCLERARGEMEGAGRAGHPLVGEARRGVLAASLGQVVERECAELAGFRPMAVEEWLGPEGEGLALAVDEGPPLMLIGRLDRRDEGPGGAVRVSDYKHTRNASRLTGPLRQADLGRTAFQIPLYLAGALIQAGRLGAEAEGRVVPTALVGNKTGSLRYPAGDRFLSLDRGARQVLAQAGEPNLFNAIEALWQWLQGGDLAPRPDKVACGLCDFAGACRARALAQANGEGAGGAGGDA